MGSTDSNRGVDRGMAAGAQFGASAVIGDRLALGDATWWRGGRVRREREVDPVGGADKQRPGVPVAHP